MAQFADSSRVPCDSTVTMTDLQSVDAVSVFSCHGLNSEWWVVGVGVVGVPCQGNHSSALKRHNPNGLLCCYACMKHVKQVVRDPIPLRSTVSLNCAH